MKTHYLRAHGYFTLWVFLLSLLPLFIYWSIMPRPDELLSQVYRISSLGYYGLLLAIVALLTLPLSQWRYSRVAYALLLAGWLLYLVIDVATFNLYLFHVDWLMIEMFIMDFSGIGIPLPILLVAAAVALGCFAGLVWLSYKTAQMRIVAYTAPLTLVVSLCALLFIGNSVINIWASHYQRQEITYINPYLPLYRPVTSNAHAALVSSTMPSWFPAEYGASDSGSLQEKSVVQYPLQPLQCTPQAQSASVLLLLVESWQADTLTPEVMPNLSRFSEQAMRFNNHLSGGSATVPGLFSLFFGLHASYYPVFKATPQANPSQLTETLANLGYDTQVYTNTNLERFAVRQLIFPRLGDENFHGGKSDRSVVNSYLRNNANPNNDASNHKPQFNFVFLTSSHSPYKYPSEYALFHPVPAVKAGYAFNKNSDSTVYKNDYYNSLAYVDSLLGEILQQLEETGALENTWVIITGDHGEEFNENKAGFWGHGSNFTRWQTQTPLLVRAPNTYRRAQQAGAQAELHLSTHQDIAPTILQEVLGCTTPAAAYSNGENLFNLPEKRTSVISSYYNHAYWVDGTVLDRSTGKQYQWNDFNQRSAAIDNTQLRSLREAERRFLKSKAELKD